MFLELRVVVKWVDDFLDYIYLEGIWDDLIYLFLGLK